MLKRSNFHNYPGPLLPASVPLPLLPPIRTRKPRRRARSQGTHCCLCSERLGSSSRGQARILRREPGVSAGVVLGGHGQGHHLDKAVPSLCWGPNAKLSALSIAKAQASLPHTSPSSSSSSSSPQMKNCDFLAFRACAAWEVGSGSWSHVCTVAPCTGAPLTALQVEMVLPLILKCHKCGVWLCFLSFAFCFKAFLPSTRKMQLCVLYSRDSRSTGL